jgi:xanthine/CO dehydrogenase XdhC/CoxF family maturation factor
MERGVAAQRLTEITCPIGVEGIADKAPWSIGLAVAAQLLRVRAVAARVGAEASRTVRATA